MRLFEKLKEKVQTFKTKAQTVKAKVLAGTVAAMTALMGTGVTAFAADASGGGLDSVMTTVTTLTKGAGDMLSTIVANPILVVFLAGSVAGVILSLLRKIKSTAGGR